MLKSHFSMKINKKNNLDLKLSLVVVLFISSCTNNFEEINTNEFLINEASPEQIFAGVVKNTLDLVGGTMNDQMFNSYASYYGGKGGQFSRFFYQESALDNYWTKFYVNILKNNQEIIDKFSENPEYSNRVYIAKIWKSYVFSIMVSTFGPVPYKDALSGQSSASYDSEEFIYTDILNVLKEAAENIDTNGDFLQEDPIFNGDLIKWKKFANTLRLKIALRISEGFRSLADQHGSDAMLNEDNLLSSNAENVVMKWGTAQENWSYNYSRYVFVQANNDVIPYINFHFLLNLKTYSDPRLFKLVEPSPEPITIEDQVFSLGSNTELITVRYDLPYFGRPLGGNAIVDEWESVLNPNDNILGGLTNYRFSKPKEDLFMTQDMSYNIITYAETNFIKAEAQLLGWGGALSAEQYYYEGIDASFEQYEAIGVAEYKEKDGIKWNTPSIGDRDLFGLVTSGITADPMETVYDQIARQRWLASFNQGHDIWCMQKRTRRLPFIDQFNPDGATGLDYAALPERMVYPPVSESVLNGQALQEAISNLPNSVPGYPIGNSMYNTIKMNKIYNPIDWENEIPEYNQDFAKHFYGDSEDDLIAAGVNYIIQ